MHQNKCLALLILGCCSCLSFPAWDVSDWELLETISCIADIIPNGPIQTEIALMVVMVLDMIIQIKAS